MNLKCLVPFLGLVLFSNTSFAQTIDPAQLGFEAYQLKTDELGVVNYYLTPSTDDEPKPLMVYLDGSGADPLFQQVEQGISSTIAMDYQQLSKNYQVLVISKPGVPFIGKGPLSVAGYSDYKEPVAYTERLSLAWRVESAHLIIQKLVEENTVDPTRIVILGFSEGAQVAPFVAEKNQHVSHVLLFGGNGLNQFFDPIITARQKALTGQTSEESAQRTIDSLYSVYADIYAQPASTQKRWWGHTYKRWASFAQRDPLEVLIELDIPIYMANGSLDENSVLSADYIKLEFIRQGKQNLTYKTYPNYDHQFNELIFENGAFKDAIPQLDYVLNAAFEWLEEN